MISSGMLIVNYKIVLCFSYGNCNLTKYMEKHKIKPDGKAFHLVSANKLRFLMLFYNT